MNISGLAEARKEKGVSQRALAKHLGISRAHLYRIETETLRHGPGVFLAIKIADALGMWVEDVWKVTNEPERM